MSILMVRSRKASISSGEKAFRASWPEKLLQFTINAITGGTEAQGEVTVRLEEKGQTVIGQGADTDVIVASAKAYINALNKIEFKKQKLVRL